METKENTRIIYVISLDKKVATRVTGNNGEYLNFLGTSSDVSYYTMSSSELLNLAKGLREGERFIAKPAKREKLDGFLPKEFWHNLEAIIGVLN